MTLHTPIFDTKATAYCGPTAIAALTGLPISVIHKRIHRVRSDSDRKHNGRVLNGGFLKRSDGRKRRIVGTTNYEVLTVLKRSGMRVVDKFQNKRLLTDRETLREFCEDRAHLGPTLVQVTGHYVTISRGMICDTLTRKPIPWQDYARLSRRVVRWWRFAERPAKDVTCS